MIRFLGSAVVVVIPCMNYSYNITSTKNIGRKCSVAKIKNSTAYVFFKI
jgi:hypothetical protein